MLLQFYRSFPRPPEVTEEQVALLVHKYRDPDRPGLLNYLNLHHDIMALGHSRMGGQVANITDYLPAQVSVWGVSRWEGGL